MKFLNKTVQKLKRLNTLIELIYNQSKQSEFIIKRQFLEFSLFYNIQNYDNIPGTFNSDNKQIEPEIIISLTTYGKRLQEVWLTIESLMQQTRRADKIILWLGEEDYKKPLPAALEIQKQKGLEIRKCKDTGSYTKLIPALKEYPDSIIITVDDDALYDCELIDRLYQSYISNPTAIHAARTHVMIFDEQGNLKNYNNWKWWSSETNNPKHLFFTGVGGVLYPPDSLDKEVFNEENFLKLSPKADDVWFNAMALKKGTKVVKINTKDPKGEDFITNENVQDIGLKFHNTLENNGNDIQIKAVYDFYKLYDKLKTLD